MVWRDVALATVSPAKNLKVKEKKRVTYLDLPLLPLVPPRLGHEEHDGGGVRVPVRQLSVLLPSERHCPDAVDDHEGGVDEEKRELDDSADAPEVEEEVSCGVVGVGLEERFKNLEGFVGASKDALQRVRLPHVDEDLLGLADGEEDGEDDSKDTGAHADEAEEPDEPDDQVKLGRSLEIVFVCIPVDGHIGIVVVMCRLVFHL